MIQQNSINDSSLQIITGKLLASISTSLSTSTFSKVSSRSSMNIQFKLLKIWSRTWMEKNSICFIRWLNWPHEASLVRQALTQNESAKKTKSSWVVYGIGQRLWRISMPEFRNSSKSFFNDVSVFSHLQLTQKVYVSYLGIVFMTMILNFCCFGLKGWVIDQFLRRNLRRWNHYRRDDLTYHNFLSFTATVMNVNGVETKCYQRLIDSINV